MQRFNITCRGLDFRVHAAVETKPRYGHKAQIVGEKVQGYDYLEGYDVTDLHVGFITYTDSNMAQVEVTYARYPKLYEEIQLLLVEQIEQQINE